MRWLKWMIVIVVMVVIWILAVIFGPTTIKKEAVAWDPGLLLGMIFLFMFLAYVMSFFYTYRMHGPGCNWTLSARDAVATVDLPKMEKSSRSNRFLMYKLGGTVWVPRSGGGDRGYLIANADLIHVMPGDLTNLRVNSHLDCYRMNPNGYEKPIQSLPMQFKNTLATIKGFSEKHSPVWVAWDPVELDQPEEQVREALKYKDQWEITNQQLDHLTKQLRSTNTISAQLASTAMASGELGMQNIRDRGKKPLLRNRSTDEEDEDR